MASKESNIPTTKNESLSLRIGMDSNFGNF